MACRFLLSGLRTLCLLGYVHRNISADSFLWSPADLCFKFKDFQNEVDIFSYRHDVFNDEEYDSGEYMQNTSKIPGEYRP